MNIEQAIEICNSARKTGTLGFTAEQRVLFKQASEVRHQWQMNNDAAYARRFNQQYNQMARDLGRIDLIAKAH